MKLFIIKGIRKIIGISSFQKSIKLDREKRSAICMGTARGLAYLHEELVPHIMHNIKASNIFLDENFQQKIEDFGLAKLFPHNITHISTRIAGTTHRLPGAKVCLRWTGA